MIPEIPLTLLQKLVNVHGSMAKEWAALLPDYLSQLFAEQNLQFVKEFENLSYSWVMVVERLQQSYILKLAPPEAEWGYGVEALKAFSSCAGVQLLGHDSRVGMLLLEHLQPGKTVSSLQDEAKEIEVASALMQSMTRASTTSELPHLNDWLLGFERYLATSQQKLDSDLCLKAMALGRQLSDSMEEEVLLHGDLHHDNILSSGDTWRFIDPKGVVGCASFEVTAFMRNPFPALAMERSLQDLLSFRLEGFSHHLGYERRRMRDWSFVQAMLSAVWFLEDGDGANALGMQHIAQAFDSLS